MAYLLRALNLLMLLGLGIVLSTAHGINNFIDLDHLRLSIPYFIYTIFTQAFIMFYFIGVSRFTKNIWEILCTKNKLEDLFENPPQDLSPYIKKTRKFVMDSDLCKRQTIPWTMLILVLGTFAFLLGGAHDTNLVTKHVHSGVAYGFTAATIIGFFKQWIYLGKSHLLLRKIKSLFMISDAQM